MFQQSRKSLSLIILIVFVLHPINGYALPQGESVVSGSANFDRTTADTLNINQSSDQLIAEYQSFSIGEVETVNFNQPSVSAVALNRVVGVSPSAIFGTLNATGKVFLINSNGILFGPDAQVNAAGMVAATLDIDNQDFLDGKLIFSGTGDAVLNQGDIALNAPGGYAALIGSSVANSGSIIADLGSVVLASGEAVTLQMDALGLISVVIDQATTLNPAASTDAVANSGSIIAAGGKVVLTAKAVAGVFNDLVNHSGVVSANTLSSQDGVIELVSNQDVLIADGAALEAAGDILVSASNEDGSAEVVVNGEVASASGDILVEAVANNTETDTHALVEISGTLIADTGNITVLADNFVNVSKLQKSFGNDENFARIALTGAELIAKDGVLRLTAENDVITEMRILDNGQLFFGTSNDLNNFAEIVAVSSTQRETTFSAKSATFITDNEVTNTVISDFLDDYTYTTRNYSRIDLDAVFKPLSGNADPMAVDLTAKNMVENIIDVGEGIDTSTDTSENFSEIQAPAYELALLNDDGAAPEGRFTQESGASLSIEQKRPDPDPDPEPDPQPEPDVEFGGNITFKDFRAYYEILDQYRLNSFEPATPTEFYAYHPLTPTDDSAFDGIRLDRDAYEFIDGNLKTNRPLGVFFGENEEEDR